MFRTFGAPEIILILVIIFIFFGVGKLPQVGAALGKGLRAFRKGQTGEDDIEEPATEAASPATRTRKATRTKRAASKEGQ
jgi:sec-independent protein translocase protein TatA